MYLYDNDGEFVCIYELIAKEDKIREYKRKEMEKVPEDNRIWTSVASSIDDRVFITKLDMIPSSKLEFYIPYVSGVSSHELLPQNSDKNVIDEYYNSCSSFGRVLKVKKGRTNNLPEYFIVTKDNYIKDNDSHIMKDIIGVPESLYLLELLLSKRYDLIKDITDVAEQLDLFEVREVSRINIQLLRDMANYGIMPSDSVDELVTRRRKLLTLNRKKKV